jgi:hypothetical protein
MFKENYKLLKEKDLADFLSVSPRTVRRMRNKRLLPFFKLASGLIRFCPKQCERALSQGEVKSVGDHESVSLAGGASAFKSQKVTRIKPKAHHALPKPRGPQKALTKAARKSPLRHKKTNKTESGKNRFGHPESTQPLAPSGSVLN